MDSLSKQTSKLKIGIFFGGKSREREVSFAGGRTVFDNLNKSLFEAIPIFVDSFGTFIQLDWQYIYKGSIRDFFPPASLLQKSEHDFQHYIENLQLNEEKYEEAINSVGKKISAEQLPNLIDFAFLALHGPSGEDGNIQGLLEWLEIPYSGTGILGSAIGIDKVVQRKLQNAYQYKSPKSLSFNLENEEEIQLLKEKVSAEIGFPCVVKSPRQGSSIGVSIVDSESSFEFAVLNALFQQKIAKSEWNSLEKTEKVEFVRNLLDIRSNLGFPLKVLETTEILISPDELMQKIEGYFEKYELINLKAKDASSQVLVEQFIEGKEFSVIVIEDETGENIALPPTEIRKLNNIYDYTSKYLPGLSKKITPIDLKASEIKSIIESVEQLKTDFFFDVYARIDGFFSKNGEVFLNDPNTTSGMLPSSFFFHQAAEIGLNPSQFLTYIIVQSLRNRLKSNVQAWETEKKLNNLLENLKSSSKAKIQKTKVAVIMGGYSSERHISVESGRNIYEKLSSSENFEPIPCFLILDEVEKDRFVPEEQFSIWQIPINLMLKDNADDILATIQKLRKKLEAHPIVEEIKSKTKSISSLFASNEMVFFPKNLKLDELAGMVDFAFIALHGRPGEDGTLQQYFIKENIPFNGSDVESSQITIDKFSTLQLLKQKQLHGAEQFMVEKQQWTENQEHVIKKVQEIIAFPMIAKPHDEGCSSAVKMLKNAEDLKAYAEAVFREKIEFPEHSAKVLKLDIREEFPQKIAFLLESLVRKTEEDEKFLEVTVGLLTHRLPNGEKIIEVLEPSETVAEEGILSLSEKFLAGQGQNITPARFSSDQKRNQKISELVKIEIGKAAEVLNIEGYARIDAFVHIRKNDEIFVDFIEVNSLPGMTPATCIFHQAAINDYQPLNFIEKIIEYGIKRTSESK